MKSPSLKSDASNGNGEYRPISYNTADRLPKIRDYLRVFYRGRWIILISFVTIFLITLYITFTTEPVYTASAKLIIEEKSGVGQSLFDFSSIAKKETMINNQVEILKSRTLAEYVVRDLQASSRADSLRTLGNAPPGAKRRVPLSARLKRVFVRTSSKKGRPLTDEERFDNYVQSLQGMISVIPIRNTDIIEIRVSAHSPTEAAYVTNAVANAFNKRSQEQSQAEVRQVKEFLEKQMNQYEEHLADSEEKLKSYQQAAHVVALDQETAELVRKAADFETYYNEAVTSLEAAKQRLAYIDGQLNQRQIDFDVETISSQPYLNELKKQIAEKEAKMVSYAASLIEIGDYERHREQVKREYEAPIEALKKKLNEEIEKLAAAEFLDPAQINSSLFTSKINVETEIQALKPKVDAFRELVEQYNNDLEKLPAKKLELARLMRSTQVDEKLYIMLQEKYQESRITEVGQLGNVRVIDWAKPPEMPVKPKPRLNIMVGIILGLGLGIGIAFTMEYLDNSVRSIEDIESLQLPLMVTIPFIKPEANNGVLARLAHAEDPEAEEISDRLVTHLRAKSPISEAYRTLRTNILFSAPDNPKHIILVTSSGPKEGKSTSVSNLAITFSQMGTKTLLIDGDLRRPMVHKLFNLDKHNGLTNVLVGKSTLKETVTNIPALPNLDLLTCGVTPPNPAEILGSAQMRDLLIAARKEYGMIFIDTPPIMAVADPSVLSPVVDGVIVVVRSGITNREGLVRAIEQLCRVEAPLLGVLLNGLKVSDVYGSYYYAYQYYYDADGDKKKRRRRTRKRARV